MVEEGKANLEDAREMGEEEKDLKVFSRHDLQVEHYVANCEPALHRSHLQIDITMK